VVDIIPGGPEALELEGRMTAEEVQQALWLLDASMPVVVSREQVPRRAPGCASATQTAAHQLFHP